jgi:murein hydrolase activator
VSTADQRLKQVRDRKESLARELARLRSQERSLLGDVERLEIEVRLRGEELRETQITLQKTQAQMDDTLKQVNKLEAGLAESRPQLAAHARALYKLGELSYLRLLLSVDRPADLFRGYRFVTALARRDNARIERFRSDLAALRAERDTLEKKTQESLVLRSELETARRNLDADRKRKTELLTSLVEKKELHAAYVQELTDAEARLGEMLDGFALGEVAVPLGAFRGALPWPATGKIKVAFGKRRDPKFDTYTRENGVEIDAPADATVAAVHEGTVVFADRFRGYGLMVVLDHGAKHHSLYAHLGEIRVEVGQKLAEGDTVGTVGSSGIDGTGLYFEMRFQGRPEDPQEWLRKGGER